MTAQNGMHLENWLRGAGATVQHSHTNAQCSLVRKPGLSQEFSDTRSNQGGAQTSCVNKRNNEAPINLHNLIVLIAFIKDKLLLTRCLLLFFMVLLFLTLTRNRVQTKKPETSWNMNKKQNLPI